VIEPEDDERYFEVNENERTGSTPLAQLEAGEEYEAAERFIMQSHGGAEFLLELEPIGERVWIAEYRLVGS
jgi:hypothetical protein